MAGGGLPVGVGLAVGLGLEVGLEVGLPVGEPVGLPVGLGQLEGLGEEPVGSGKGGSGGRGPEGDGDELGEGQGPSWATAGEPSVPRAKTPITRAAATEKPTTTRSGVRPRDGLMLIPPPP